jgi:site-specific DNA recombinase
MYCGNILAHGTNKGESYLVKGQHKGLISEDIFARVQNRFNHSNRTSTSKKNDNDSLPLRRFLRCPTCHKVLTGSASKGRNNYYYYYHCRKGCKFRVRANLTNDIFLSELKKLVPDVFYVKAFRAMLEYIDLEARDEAGLTQTEINRSIKRLWERVGKAKDLLISGEIDSDDFRGY